MGSTQGVRSYEDRTARVGLVKSKPAMLAVGMKDRAIAPENQISDFKAIWPDGPVIKLPHAGHFSQEDAPDTIIALVELFIQSAR